MISDIAAWLFELFVLDPLQVEMREHLGKANVPVSTLQQSRQCLTSNGQQLLQRAGDEPSWAVSTAMGVAIGWTSPVQLLDPSNPSCDHLIRILNTENDTGGEA